MGAPLSPRCKLVPGQTSEWPVMRPECPCQGDGPRESFADQRATLPIRAVVRFYNKRGTLEQWVKEGNEAVKMTRLSCHRYRSDEVRLWLSVIACNPGDLWRRLVLPTRIDEWSLASLQQRPVKAGG